ncbi:MAG TPA: Xaa-Pro dipeptidase, partial [Thermoanaerobaculia bacterium]
MTLADLYPAHIETLEQRHDAALAATKFDHALISSGSLKMIFLDDMPYPFKANPHFKSWVPVLDNPNCFLVYTPGKKPTLLFNSPVDFWHKVSDKPAGSWVDHFDIHYIADPDEAQPFLPTDRKRIAFIGEWDASFETWGIGNANPQPLLDYLHHHRAWKTDYEIECMREANRIGARGHIAAARAFRAGATEYAIHLEYLRATAHVESQLPYGNIIALNEHAAVLHWQHQSQTPPAELHSFLIDAGASFNGYASDITRTYSRNGDEFRALIDAMNAMQLELCDAVKPGLDYKELQLTTHRKVGQLLATFGFVSDAEAAYEKGVTRAFFPHGVGHYIGLQVHDVGGFSAD